ncbi:hypothetical protein Q0812_04765 [Brevundimonas sp. 2R-24]|uniref:Lipoprotein n=1 Tax=Peiella sedimenti TaxID=3061083 RepID=A0ABT8SK20_9CAUL|nr:hypothetical protein [Caulobacteraceae bacterium XZ-24]
MRALFALGLLLTVAACAAYEGPPQNPYAQYEQQERIRREVEERQSLCATLDRDDERWERLCSRSVR